MDLLERRLVDHRPDVGVVLPTRSKPQLLDGGDEFFLERVVDALVRDDARCGRAALAGRPERGPHDAFDREVEIGVVHDDDRVLAAQLEVHVLECLRPGLEHLHARLARAGERDHADVGMAHHTIADAAPAAEDDVHHAVREAGLAEQLDEALRERRRVARRLQHDGVPADERRDELPRRDRDREVPRRNRADDADRHAYAHVPLVRQLRRSRLAVEAPPLAGHVVRDVDRLLDVPARLGAHLAHLVRHQVGERVLLLLEQSREAEEDLPALRARHEPPVRVRLLRGRDRAVDVVGGRAREDADRLAVGRARALEGLGPRRGHGDERNCYVGASVSGNVPGMRARRRSRVSRCSSNSAVASPARRSGPSRRSTMTVTFGLSL